MKVYALYNCDCTMQWWLHCDCKAHHNHNATTIMYKVIEVYALYNHETSEVYALYTYTKRCVTWREIQGTWSRNVRSVCALHLHETLCDMTRNTGDVIALKALYTRNVWVISTEFQFRWIDTQCVAVCRSCSVLQIRIRILEFSSHTRPTQGTWSP